MTVMSKDSQDPVGVSRALLAERRALLAKGRELIAQKHELQRRFAATQGGRAPITVYVDRNGEADGAPGALPA